MTLVMLLQHPFKGGDFFDQIAKYQLLKDPV